jgi:EpsI family protein
MNDFGAPLRRVGAALLVAMFLLLYYAPLRSLAEYWTLNDMYSYGFLVPLISGYVIWLRRDLLRVTPVIPALHAGAIVLGTAVCMLVLGHVSSTNLLVWMSLPIAIAGLCLLVLGVRMTRAVAFPLAYLFAMIPFWDFLTVRLQAPFQLYSAIVGVETLRFFGLPVIREGVLIHLPRVTLEVADVCSGVNQLVAILCIGIPVTHMHVRRWPKRLLIVMLAVVIALLSNGVRVAVISLFALQTASGPGDDVHGPYSVLRMTLISGVGFLVLFWLIARFSDPASPGGGPGTTAAERRPAAGTRSLAGLSVAVAILGGTIAFERWHQVAPVPLEAELGQLPSAIGEWRDAGAWASSPSVQAGGFDRELSRRYVAPDGSEVELLVGYFEQQRQGHELVGYEVSRLLSMETGPFAVDLNPDVRVKDFLTSNQGRLHHVTYWYHLNGRIVSDGYRAKLWTAWDSLTRRRSNASVVIVRTRVSSAAALDASRVKVRGFLEALVGASRSYL